ncbi:MAG: MFS transporter [Bordetella sp.]
MSLTRVKKWVQVARKDDILQHSSARGLLKPGVRRREFWAWASLDFANSGYTTVVLTAVFNAYFVAFVMQDAAHATLVWTLVLSVSYLLVMVSAPWLGAWADQYKAKRKLLWLASLACILATALLASVGQGQWLWAALLLVISNLAYASHQDLAAGYLFELAPEDKLGRLSGYGWAWGYLGGLVSLVLALAWVQVLGIELSPAIAQVLGLANPVTNQGLATEWAVGGAMVLTALLFALVGLPALMVLKDHQPAQPQAQWQGAWRRLVQGWTRLGEGQPLRQLLVCIAVYQSGVATVITLAAIYAQQVMGFSMAQTIALVLVVNVTASIGAFLFGLLQDRLGHKRSLALSLVLWILMVLVAAFSTNETGFWLAANLAGLAMGASQSGARAAVAALSEPNRQAESFGYWGVAINLASVCGPLCYGLTSWLSGNNHRLAIAFTGLFFLVGLILLLRIPFSQKASQRLFQTPSE